MLSLKLLGQSLRLLGLKNLLRLQSCLPLKLNLKPLGQMNLQQLRS